MKSYYYQICISKIKAWSCEDVADRLQNSVREQCIWDLVRGYAVVKEDVDDFCQKYIGYWYNSRQLGSPLCHNDNKLIITLGSLKWSQDINVYKFETTSRRN